MGNKGMEAGGNGISQNTASIISFSGKDLPESYRNMILAKWLNNHWSDNDLYRLMERGPYFSYYQKFLEKLFLLDDFLFRLAVLTDDHDIVLGWSAMDNDTLHYVFVNTDYRNLGFMRLLVPIRPSRITHITKRMLKIWPAKFPDAVFNPFY